VESIWHVDALNNRYLTIKILKEDIEPIVLEDYAKQIKAIKKKS
jgi:hypothetical protein